MAPVLPQIAIGQADVLSEGLAGTVQLRALIDPCRQGGDVRPSTPAHEKVENRGFLIVNTGPTKAADQTHRRRGRETHRTVKIVLS